MKKHGISRTAILELLVPPRSGTRNASRYHALVKARVPGKDNSKRKYHQDAHCGFAQVKYVKKMSTQYSDERCILSSDNTYKVNFVTLAFSQYHQISKFFPISDTPYYKDHDFSYRKSRIISSGYMLLTRTSTLLVSIRSHSLSPRRNSPPRTSRKHHSCPLVRRTSEIQFDKLHRVHHLCPRTGPVYVFNRAAKFHSSTSVAIALDLTSVTDETRSAEKPVLALIVDGVPDWNPSHIVNFLSYGRLWKDQQLDSPIIVTHALQPTYNPIEHALSVLSRCLTGVNLVINLSGERPPHEQHFSDEELRSKEAVVFDAAIDELNNYWENQTFGCHPTLPRKVQCLEPNQRYNDHADLDCFAKSLYRAIADDSSLRAKQDLLAFLCKHAVRSIYLTLFLRCQKPSCQHRHAQQLEVKEVVSLLRSCGARLFSQTPDPMQPGHFLTFTECSIVKSAGKKLSGVGEVLPLKNV